MLLALADASNLRAERIENHPVSGALSSEGRRYPTLVPPVQFSHLYLSPAALLQAPLVLMARQHPPPRGVAPKPSYSPHRQLLIQHERFVFLTHPLSLAMPTALAALPHSRLLQVPSDCHLQGPPAPFH